MKVLLDSCIWGGARLIVAQNGHDVIWAGDWMRDPGDEAILAIAFHEGRILATLDQDFCELAIVRQLPHIGIIRLVGFSAQLHGSLIVAALRAHEASLATGAVVTIEPGRVRVRPRSDEN